MVCLTFFGVAHTEVSHRPGVLMSGVMVVLAALSLLAGFVETPHTLGGVSVFSRFLGTALPAPAEPHAGAGAELALQVAASAAVLLGLGAAAYAYLRQPPWFRQLAASSAAAALHRLWSAGWGFDWLYDRLVVRPFVGLARINRGDVIDRLYAGLAWLCRTLHARLSETQNGLVRRYAMGIAAGAVIALAIVAFL